MQNFALSGIAREVMVELSIGANFGRQRFLGTLVLMLYLNQQRLRFEHIAFRLLADCGRSCLNARINKEFSCDIVWKLNDAFLGSFRWQWHYVIKSFLDLK